MTSFASVTPNLVVRDVAKSTAFYRDVLGFEIKQTVPDAEPFIDLDTMLDMTAKAEVNGVKFDGVDLFLADAALASREKRDKLMAIAGVIRQG